MENSKIGYVWNFGADLGNGRSSSVSWNSAVDATTEDMNAAIDQIRAVFDRQQAKSAARGLEEEIERLAGQKKQVLDTIGRVDNKAENKGGMSAAERQQRETAVINVESLTTNIESKQKLLQKLTEEAK